MKTFGRLAFRPDLRVHIVRELLEGEPTPQHGDEVSVLFFTRIGRELFREAIDREMGEERARHELEERLNAALPYLPPGFRWARNPSGELTQPVNWSERHIGALIRPYQQDTSSLQLQHDLRELQNRLNTAPDIVLQWPSHLALIEIKALSDEGNDQLDRQYELGQFFKRLFSWNVDYFFVDPDLGTWSIMHTH